MGKFDKRLPNEKEGERQMGSKRQQFMPVTDSKGTERSATSALADSILRAKADDVLDVRHAIGKIETERHDKRSKARSENDDDRQDSRGQQSRSSRGRGGSGRGGSGRGGSGSGGSGGRGGRGSAGKGGRGGSAMSSRGGRGDRGRSSARGGRGGSSRGGRGKR